MLQYKQAHTHTKEETLPIGQICSVPGKGVR